MKKTEIEFLRAAGFTLEEIMQFETVQNDGNEGGSSPGSQLEAGQNAQTAPAAPAQQPAAPAQQPAAPAQLPADNNPALTDILNKILSAIQAGNMAAASIQTPAPQSPEDLAGKLY